MSQPQPQEKIQDLVEASQATEENSKPKPLKKEIQSLAEATLDTEKNSGTR